MPITEKECECGCGKKFHGTSRRKYFNNTCKNRIWRLDKKLTTKGETINE